MAKRSFDFIFALVGLLITWWVILVAWIVASFDTRMNGMFVQTRIGRGGKPFRVYKLRTMCPSTDVDTSVTTANDARITPFGGLLRKFKIDELPQLINVLLGQMSFVGPRPDVPGYADRLSDEDSVILSVRPGITGPATLKYRNEEELLAAQPDPKQYNDEVIYPDKVRLNREYVLNYSFINDLKYIVETILH